MWMDEPNLWSLWMRKNVPTNAVWLFALCLLICVGRMSVITNLHFGIFEKRN